MNISPDIWYESEQREVNDVFMDYGLTTWWFPYRAYNSEWVAVRDPFPDILTFCVVRT